MSVGHYENFPVASWLCPPSLRPAVVAIYHFARTADDIADEGEQADGARLQDLAAYRAELHRVAGGAAPGARWRPVFEPLAAAIAAFALPPRLLHDLLDAFEQDVRNPCYADREQLLDYCRRSANPVGRLLLHLYGVDDARSLVQSDAVCSALQLINFWQDLGVDAPRNRLYVPLADAARHGVEPEMLRRRVDTPAVRALVADLCRWAEQLMHEGAPLARRLPGRAGWELRLVVQGGLAVLAKIRRMEHATLQRRPTLGAADLPRLAWSALRMPAR